jgi:hypothetical protein
MNRSIKNVIAALAAGLILTACGGGGGGGTTDPANTTSGNTTPVTPMVAQNFQAAIAPTYTTGSEELGFFNAVNAFRTSQGLGPLNQNSYYDLASAAHANYVNLNTLSHFETAGLPGYTGSTPLVRVQYQAGITLPNDSSGTEAQSGCSLANPTPSQCVANAVGEEMGIAGVNGIEGVPGSGAGLVATLLNTVYHRATFMYQGITDIGSYISMAGTSVSDNGYVTQQVNAGNYFSVYPLNAQTAVSLHTHNEDPSPVPAGTDITTIGSPINVASQESTTLVVTSFTVTQSGSTTPMSATLHTSNSDANMAGSINVAFLLPNETYLPNTTYTVTFTGTIMGAATGTTNGIPVNQSWSFTTGTTSD